MPFAPVIQEEKPYNTCLDCTHIGKICDGPDFLAMDIPRLSEWCRMRKEILHKQDPKWTNAYIAEQADFSKITVDRFLSGHMEDVKFTTAAAIVRVLVNGTWGQYPCAMAALAEKEQVFVDNPALLEQIEKLQAELLAQAAAHKDELAALRAYDEQRIEYLKEQVKFKDKMFEERGSYIRRKNRIIQILSCLLGFTVLLIFAALIVDMINPNIGYFWLDSAMSVIGS